MSDEKRGRGRPIKDTIGDAMVSHSPKWFALRVFAKEAQHGLKRMAAVDAVISDLKLPVSDRERLKRYASRFTAQDDGVLVEIAKNDVLIAQRSTELLRRIAGMSGYLLDRAGTLPAGPFLTLLRAHEIDGTCPAWLASALRAHPDVEGHELMKLIKQEAPDKP